MKFLDYVNLGYIWLRSYLTRLKVWSGTADPGQARISYGHEKVPGPDEHVFGGMVKLQDLNKHFPHVGENPTILYLVSSALPYFPLQLVRMAQKRGAKLVLNQNGVAYPGWYGKGYERANRTMSRLHSMADHVFYQSEFCKISAEKFLEARGPESKSEILYNPVDTDVFRPKRQPGDDGNVFTILLAGSHWSTYRVFVALDTLQKVRAVRDDVVLKIAGRFCWREDTGKAKQEVYDYATRLGLQGYVEYTGPYSQNIAPELFSSCSLLLHTKYNDPCPRLVVEAMACGLPVVYSATGGVAELVGQEAGRGVAGPLDWYCDHPPDPVELADGISTVIDNLACYQLAARERAVSRFGVSDWISRHREVFCELSRKQ